MTVLYSSQLNIVTVQARPGKRPRCQGPETPGEDEELAALGLGLRLYKGVSGRAGESGQGRSGRGVHGVCLFWKSRKSFGNKKAAGTQGGAR